MAEPIYDKKEQFDQVASGLLRDERIIAVYDAVGAGTGFMGLTDRRVMVQDTSFVGKNVAIVSIPYDKITSVAVLSNKSWVGAFFSTSSIAVNVSDRSYIMEFRGTDKAHHAHNVILHRITR